MTCRICSRRRMGFSLVELLAVVGIIALLIAILIPSLNVVKIRAKSAATLNTIRVLETSLETFKADMVVGGAYPESAVRHPLMLNGVVNPDNKNGISAICGASFLVWALQGADGQGTPGFRDLNGNGTWRDDTGTTGLYAIHVGTNQPIHNRSGPFLASEKARTSTPRRLDNTNDPNNRTVVYDIERYSIKGMPAPVFLDAFDRPILYYRANLAGGDLAGVQPSNALIPRPYYYDLYDNYLFTGLNGAGGLDLGAGSSHPMSILGTVSGPGAVPTPKYSFAYTIRDPNVTALTRPYRPDSYLLVSTGPDGKWGSPDDIGNFPTNK